MFFTLRFPCESYPQIAYFFLSSYTITLKCLKMPLKSMFFCKLPGSKTVIYKQKNID